MYVHILDFEYNWPRKFLSIWSIVHQDEPNFYLIAEAQVKLTSLRQGREQRYPNHQRICQRSSPLFQSFGSESICSSWWTSSRIWENYGKREMWVFLLWSRGWQVTGSWTKGVTPTVLVIVTISVNISYYPSKISITVISLLVWSIFHICVFALTDISGRANN